MTRVEHLDGSDWWHCDYLECEAKAQSGTNGTKDWRVIVSGQDRQHRHYCPIHSTDAAMINALDPNRHNPVNHPSHYTSHPSGIECIQITEHMNFCLGNAIKYLWRAGSKDGTSDIEDLEKAKWYVEREIARRKSLEG